MHSYSKAMGGLKPETPSQQQQRGIDQTGGGAGERAGGGQTLETARATPVLSVRLL